MDKEEERKIINKMLKISMLAKKRDLAFLFGVKSQSISSAIARGKIPLRWFDIIEDQFGVTRDEICNDIQKNNSINESNITATISPGDVDKFYNLQEINKQPVYKDGSLRLLVMWMNEYFEKYPHQVVGFVEDLRKIYPSFDAFVEQQGGPDRGEIKKDVI